jgi:glutathione reductase (NADPH)
MGRHDVDLCVLGGGSAGIRAAVMSARHGARVALVEPHDLGGTCVNAGCIPKKLWMYASSFGFAFERARGHGWVVGSPTLDWPAMLAGKDAEVARLRAVYAQKLEEAGVEFVRGRGRFRDAHTLEVEGRTLSAAHTLIATGGRPRVPALPGAEHAITSDETFRLPRLPARVVIVGAGYVALEFASIFRGFGSEVTLVCRGDHVLRGFDHDVGATLAEELTKHGITIHWRSEVRAIERGNGAWRAQLPRGPHDCDAVLFATGRTPATGDLGLDRAGVAVRDDGAIVVDAHGRTSTTNIFAAGDVTGGAQLTPVAIAEGQAVADTLFAGRGSVAPEREFVPTCVFSQPQAATVGWSESVARERFGEVHVYRSRFRPLEEALGAHDVRNMVKLVVDAASDRVLGLHVVASDAAEIVQGFAAALRCGVTKAQLDRTLGIHPSVAEEFFSMRRAVA